MLGAAWAEAPVLSPATPVDMLSRDLSIIEDLASQCSQPQAWELTSASSVWVGDRGMPSCSRPGD